MNPFSEELKRVYPVCSRLAAEEAVPLPRRDTPLDVKNFPERLAEIANRLRRHPYLADLARVESAVHEMNTTPPAFPARVEELRLNPAMVLLPVSWHHLPERLQDDQIIPHRSENGFVLVWKAPSSGRVQAATAGGHDLLALKIVSEGIDPRRAAADGGVSLGTIDNIL